MQNLSSDLQQRASGIKLLILDVDGVLTDGRIFIRDNGEEIKCKQRLLPAAMRLPSVSA